MSFSCIIIGGGASGLAAASLLTRSGVRTLLLERLDRVGKKLLSTGNGRCNYSNSDVHPKQYGSSEAFVRTLWGTVPPDSVRAHLYSLGLLSCEEDGRLYPRTLSAASVLDVLRAPLSGGSTDVLTDSQAVSLRHRGLYWEVVTSAGQTYRAASALLCAGGCAASKFGTDGSGYRLASALGHTIKPPVPALVQLRCRHHVLSSLKGLRVHAAPALLVGGQQCAKEEGELLFTDYGVSGVCIFQLSGMAARALAKRHAVSLSVDFLPEIPAGQATRTWFQERKRLKPDVPLSGFFAGVFPRMLEQAILKEAGLYAASAGALSNAECERLFSAIHAFSLPVTGTQGFDSAQVTSGGILTEEVDPQTMESLLCPGLHFAGEVLDVDGPCGGYNLHFAFASGLCAAMAVINKEQS